MKRAIFSVAVAIALTAVASAQDKPSFAGTWKASGSFNTWTITTEGNKMTVTMTVAGNSESTLYMLDGTPSPKAIEGPDGMSENIYTSTWEGPVLVTTITGKFVTLVEKRWIDADCTMKVLTTMTMLQGKPAPPRPETPMVFTKVG